MAEFVGAVDQGTTSSRFMIFDHDGREVAKSQLEHEQILPRPGWVEHDPVEIAARTEDVIREALTDSNLTAADLVGAWLNDRSTAVLKKMARSKDLWERRVAIVATAHFINNNQFSDTLAIAKMLLNDKHDLIHKAVGWMLREVGKRDMKTEEGFLKKHYTTMPRTMLRYAIERFPERKRLAYLKGTIRA